MSPWTPCSLPTPAPRVAPSIPTQYVLPVALEVLESFPEMSQSLTNLLASMVRRVNHPLEDHGSPGGHRGGVHIQIDVIEVRSVDLETIADRGQSLRETMPGRGCQERGIGLGCTFDLGIFLSSTMQSDHELPTHCCRHILLASNLDHCAVCRRVDHGVSRRVVVKGRLSNCLDGGRGRESGVKALQERICCISRALIKRVGCCQRWNTQKKSLKCCHCLKEFHFG